MELGKEGSRRESLSIPSCPQTMNPWSISISNFFFFLYEQSRAEQSTPYLPLRPLRTLLNQILLPCQSSIQQGYKATSLPMNKCQLAPDRAAAGCCCRNQVGASIAATAASDQQLQLQQLLLYLCHISLCNGTVINHMHHASCIMHAI